MQRKVHPMSWFDTEAASSSRFDRSLLCVGLLLSLLVAILAFYPPPAFQRAKASVYDFQHRGLSSAPPSSLPLIVDVDEQSLSQYGQWPWPRYRLALLIAKLQRWGARVVALDMVFPEVDRTSPAVIKAGLEKELNISVSLEGVPESLRDNDQVLADVLARGPVVLGHFFFFDERSRSNRCSPPSTPIGIVSQGNEAAELALYDAQGVLCNIPLLAQSTPRSGFFNARPDIDGVYRKLPLLIRYEERIYPSLALEATLMALGERQLVVEQSQDRLLLRLPHRTVPLDRLGNLHLRFRGPGHTFPYVSAADILNDEVSATLFQDRIVFIGSSAAGINDRSATPTDPLMPGVELHAVAVDNLLQQDVLHPPPLSALLEALFALIAGSLFTLGVLRAGPYFGAFLLVIAGAAVVALSQTLLSREGLIVSPVPAITAMILVLTCLAILQYWRERVLTQKRFRQYQRSQEATIEGFGALAEYRDPETGGHIKRTQIFVRLLAAHLAKEKAYQGALPLSAVEILGKAAPLHDIGKVGMPDHILLKPDRLSAEEFESMKRHTIYGAQVIETIKKKVGDTPFLRYAGEIALSHQEKWDGTGYPAGLKGETIPISARLMALADVYDALISKRVYKPALSHAKARKIILEGRGSHFDPIVVDAFLKVEQAFLSVALHHADSDDHREALLKEDVSEMTSTAG